MGEERRGEKKGEERKISKTHFPLSTYVTFFCPFCFMFQTTCGDLQPATASTAHSAAGGSRDNRLLTTIISFDVC